MTFDPKEARALVERLRRISPHLDMCECEEVLQAADALTAALAEIERLRGDDEGGFSAATIGTSAIGHLREMYRPAFDALGSSGRVSLRNFIDNRATLKGDNQ